MPGHDWKSAPADPIAVADAARSGLEYRVIDTADPGVFDPYLQAETRGFLAREQNEDQLRGAREALAARRFVGVYDPASAERAQPVGTVNSWLSELTVPGGAGIPMWAISGVTVAPTHRRKGIARAMLHGELRTAAAMGVAIAGLTVSEATIYGRFGFSPATYATSWRIDTRRAQWIGPRPQGRLDFIDRTRLGEALAEVHDRVRSSRPGEILAWPGLWRRLTGVAPGSEDGEKLRGVRYADAAGVTCGVAVYRISDEGDDFTKHELELRYLISETDDGYAALWRFVLEHDLVAVVKAPLRSVDEPVRWMIADQRGAQVSITEHGWLRILDVPAALTSRTYAAAGRFVVRVSDPLGFAEGTWAMSVDDAGAATVTATDASAQLSLPVGALSSLLLGGVRARTLAAAGLVEADLRVLDAVDAVFASAQPPYLSLWY